MSLSQRLLRPIDAAWLAAFRTLFGAVLAVSMARFLAYGWIDRLFVQPSFHFKYYGFGWVEPLSGFGMHALFVLLLLLALAVSAGFVFRLTAPAFALGLIYVQLLDVSTYLNHYYLAALLALLLAASPANRTWSFDSWLARRRGKAPETPNQARVAAAWLWLFRLQIGLVYVFAGLAKAQPDWLVHAQPLRIWLGASTSLPVLGWLLTLPGAATVFSWCGFLFDSTIVLFLLYGRTRPWAYLVVVVFHGLTRLLFPIGMFPAIMILSALVFFSPSWPRARLAQLQRWFGRRDRASEASSESGAPHAPLKATLLQRAALLAGGAYCLFQLLFPLRFMAYGGNVLWHEQGMRFSWRVMVRAKGGDTTFVVRELRSGHVFHVSPRSYLTGFQESELSSQPDLVLQLAHHIARDFAERGVGPVSVHAETRVSLNGRRSAPLIDPKLDLLTQRDGLGPTSFVLPAPQSPPPHTRSVL